MFVLVTEKGAPSLPFDVTLGESTLNEVHTVSHRSVQVVPESVSVSRTESPGWRKRDLPAKGVVSRSRRKGVRTDLSLWLE